MVSTASKTDIFVTGVGGQGSLSSSTFLGHAATNADLKVVVGEIHGMAQRGGIVTSTVRIGNVYGPIISLGKADVILGFEPVETWRAMELASKNTLVITNTRAIVPPNVSMQDEPYPSLENVILELKKISDHVIALDATDIAQKAGNAQALNAVLLGVLSGTGKLPFEHQILLDVILENVPQKAVDVNHKAFDAGFAIGQKNKR